MIEANQQAKTLLTNLKADGHRLTKTRRAVIALLASLDAPTTAVELLQLLKDAGISLNKTTVYRELDFLRQQEVVRDLNISPDITYIELDDEHHHHIRCVRCNAIVDVDINTSICEDEKRISTEHGYTILDHSIEFTGICPSCQKK